MKSKCPNCGKAAPKVTTRWIDESNTGYLGNDEVLQTIDLLPDLREYLLWNGSYRHRYEPFCTLRCCEEYSKIVFFMTEYYRDPAFSGNEAEKEREELQAQQQAVEVARHHYLIREHQHKQNCEEAAKSHQDKEEQQ
jgi:hypothetical protein